MSSLSNCIVANAVMVEIEFKNNFFLLSRVSCLCCRSKLCIKQSIPLGIKTIFTSFPFHTGDLSAPSPPPQLMLQPWFIFVLGCWISPLTLLALGASVPSVF